MICAILLSIYIYLQLDILLDPLSQSEQKSNRPTNQTTVHQTVTSLIAVQAVGRISKAGVSNRNWKLRLSSNNSRNISRTYFMLFCLLHVCFNPNDFMIYFWREEGAVSISRGASQMREAWPRSVCTYYLLHLSSFTVALFFKCHESHTFTPWADWKSAGVCDTQ